MDDDDSEDDKVLRKDGFVRVPLMLMDSLQKAIFQDGASNMSKSNDASLHRPGYRFSVKMTRDSAARDALQDVYDAYEADLCNRHKNTSPEPPVISTRAAPTLDKEFDDEGDMYEAYDRDLVNRHKGE